MTMMVFSRRAAVSAFASVLALGLAACGATEPSGASDGEKKKVGVEFATLNSTFFKVVNETLPEEAKAVDLELLPTINAEFDMAKQATDIRNLLNQGVAGLIVVPADSAGIVDTLKAADEKGIPVVTMDTAPDSGPVYMSVRANNVGMGSQACEALGESVGDSGVVAEVQGALSTSSGRERNEGFASCMKEKFPNVKVLTVAGEWEADKAGSGLESLLVSNPDLDGIYLHSGGAYLSATMQALKRQGVLVPKSDDKHVVLVSNDGTAEELKAIRDGYMDATVSQPADLYAKYAVQYVNDAIKGVEHKAGPTDHESDIVELPSGILEDQLPALLVTEENVEDAGLWGNR